MPNDLPNSTWNEVDSSNTAPVPNGAPEGWFPSDVNNWGRACMGATKRFWDHINVTETTGGTTTAYTLTYDVAPQQLWAGELFSFVVNATCGASPTLNVNALGAKSLRRWNGSAWVALAAGEIAADQVLIAYYNSSGSGSYDIVGGFKDAAFSGGTLTSTTTMSGAAFNEAAGADLASASTVNIGASAGNYIFITGNTTITAFDTIQRGVERTLVFLGTPTLTHSGAIVLPTVADIAVQAGDRATFRSNGSGNWECITYQRANGAALKPGPGYTAVDTSTSVSGSYSSPMTITQGVQLFSHSYTGGNGNTVLIAADLASCYGQNSSVALSIFINGGTNAVATSVVTFPNTAAAGYPNRVLYSFVSSGTATAIEIRAAGFPITTGTAFLTIQEFVA